MSNRPANLRRTQRGKHITNEEMEQYLMVQFKQVMGDVEKKVYEEHETTEEEVRSATEFFKDNADFQKSLNRLKNLFKSVSGQPNDITTVPDSVSMEKTLLIMAEVGGRGAVGWGEVRGRYTSVLSMSSPSFFLGRAHN
jgi:hypothetical protein